MILTNNKQNNLYKVFQSSILYYIYIRKVDKSINPPILWVVV